jgi:hypothetical protein
MLDAAFESYTEDFCVLCHGSDIPTEGSHHGEILYDPFNPPQCVLCHGDLVDNIDDGHDIPTYESTLVTPTSSLGDGLPLNSRGNGAGACDYCHDDDGLSPPLILTNLELHHGTGLASDETNCGMCHDPTVPFSYQFRICQECHGADSLHNIQVDSNGDGIVGIGTEDAGYGHVGRDAGPGDSDCWGCHGFAEVSLPYPGEYPDDHPLYYDEYVEADCRFCHEYNDTPPDRHHVLYGNDLASRTNAPYSTLGTDIYVCLSCHGTSFVVVRDCLVCHTEDIDYDSDGFTDGKERSIGTDPTDDDTDDDTILDGADNCPLTANVDQEDSDGDGSGNICDECSLDPNKLESGDCGCGFEDTDSDGDGTADCIDECPYDPDKIEYGICGCGFEDIDSDTDGVFDCNDSCPSEDASGFDANQDGCIDTTSGLSDAVDTLVDEGVIDTTIADSLSSVVDNANKSADKENICSAINQLEAFKNRINAQRGKKISNEAADELIVYANNVISGLLAQLPAGESC